jgi:16S rRNA (cytosine967-C5)-methyltransferase
VGAPPGGLFPGRARRGPEPGLLRPPGHTDARRLALAVLERVRRDGAYADLALRAALGRSRLDAGGRALATELAYGTLRWRGRLDFALARVLDRGLDALEARVVEVLRLGAYQILLCDRVPDAVAVSESVRLAHAAGMGRAAGLVNAALRRLAREREALAPPALAEDPVGHLVHALSIPAWIAARWVASFGPDEAAALAIASNQAPPRTVRANRARTSREALLAELRPRFPDAAPCRFAPDGVRLDRRGDPALDPAFREGRMTMQDEASQLVVELLDPRPGERVLDACAAPGTKATAIAERVGPEGLVVGLDRHERRLALLARDAQRLGLANVRTLRADSSRPLPAEIGPERFDRILVDAPCSGIGALRRNPDARWRISPDAPARLGVVQRALLEQARPWLRRGGALVYSTCTLCAEENEAVVDGFLAEATEFRRAPLEALPAGVAPLLDPQGALRTLPHRHDADGFFAVRLERVS